MFWMNSTDSTHHSPEHIDDDESQSEHQESQGLHPIGVVELHGSLNAQPARQRCERRDEQEAGRIAAQRPPLLLHGWRAPPLMEGKRRQEED